MLSIHLILGGETENTLKLFIRMPPLCDASYIVQWHAEIGIFYLKSTTKVFQKLFLCWNMHFLT